MGIKTIVQASSQRTYEQFHFADATVSGGHIFCSGVIGTGDDGKIPDTFIEEFRHAWQKVGAVLTEAGAGFGDIVEYTSYHVGLHGHLAEFMAARDEVLSEPWPAWTAIGITDLAISGAHVEIRVTARLPE